MIIVKAELLLQGVHFTIVFMLCMLDIYYDANFKWLCNNSFIYSTDIF